MSRIIHNTWNVRRQRPVPYRAVIHVNRRLYFLWLVLRNTHLLMQEVARGTRSMDDLVESARRKLFQLDPNAYRDRTTDQMRVDIVQFVLQVTGVSEPGYGVSREEVPSDPF